MEALAREEGGSTSSSGKLKNVLMQARKICNHPDLITSAFTRDTNYPPPEVLVKQCGKMQLMDKLLTKLHADGHKVLIFSQVCDLTDLMIGAAGPYADVLYICLQHLCFDSALNLRGLLSKHNLLQAASVAADNAEHLQSCSWFIQSAPLCSKWPHAVLLVVQMTQMLDIIESYLDQQGHQVCRIDGSRQWQERQENIKRFNSEPVSGCLGSPSMLSLPGSLGLPATLGKADQRCNMSIQ